MGYNYVRNYFPNILATISCYIEKIIPALHVLDTFISHEHAGSEHTFFINGG